MLKDSAKQSSDPFQNSIRNSKAAWNKEVSALISDIINFKKLMNGWPNKFNEERTKITEPISKFPSAILEGLVNDFSQIVSKGNLIIEQQAEYSQVRRKKQPKHTEAPATNNLATSLTADLNYSLESMGSNPVSRFFTKLLSPGIGDSEKSRMNRYRTSLLKSLADLNQLCSLLEQEIVKSTPDSIFSSSKMIDKIENNWAFVNTGIMTYNNLAENKANPVLQDSIDPDINTEIQEIKNTDSVNNQEVSKKEFDKAVLAVRDFKNYIMKCEEFLPSNKEILEEFAKICKDFSWVKSGEKINYVRDLLIKYDQLLVLLNTFYNTHENSIKNIYLAYLSITKQIASELAKTNKEDTKAKKEKIKANPYLKEVIAQNYLSKWYGKLKHQALYRDKTSAIRLDVYKLLTDVRKILDSMMNSLEKSMNINELVSFSKEITEKLILIREASRILNATIRGTSHDKSFMNLLEKDLITDSPVNLDQKQRERLQRSMELKHIKELSNSYKK